MIADMGPRSRSIGADPSGGPDGVYVDAVRAVVQRLRQQIAADIAAFADDDSDVSDAYRHAALIATQGATQ